MIERESYIKKIRPFIGTDIIKVLTGIRRSGKSVMLELIQNELRKQGISDSQFIVFNFESLFNVQFCTASALYAELKRRIETKTGKTYLFFDEIQEVSQWELCINSARVDFDCDIYLTGSNAKLLSGELSTYLAGRYIEIVIYPLSFREFIEVKKNHGGEIDLAAEFRNYIEIGGMPFIANFPNDKKSSKQYLRDIYNSVILKDVVKRNNIRNVDLLERIVTYLLANAGHSFSARSIAAYLKNENRHTNSETILNYIKACCNAYLFYRVQRENIKGKKLLTINEKYYVADHGIREAVYGNNTRDIDQLLENIICLELIRRGYQISVGDSADREIDFIGRRNGKKIYIQVSYLLAFEQTIEREFGAYKSIGDNYPKYVVSLDEFDMSRDGIIHYNIRDFLLKEDWD